jgi:anaerobic selenocysteine-containing dehydrogenase/Fe-S-cluster-containing dehydrogenase component
MSQGSFTRRTFLKVVAATGASVGCSRRRQERLIPYLIPPEDIIPGEPLFYRTVCRECGAGCGVTARTREGRAIKLEGNPDDPISGGALCARGQAALQGLYAPDRFRGPSRRGGDGKLAPLSWDEATSGVAAALAAAHGKGPGAIRLVTRPEPGSAGAVQRAFAASVGAGRVVIDPQDPAPLRAAGTRLFGRAELPAFDLAAARSVVSFGADLETWLSPVELVRGLAAGRGRPGPERTRLTWIGPRLSATGAFADAWIPVDPGGELWLASAVLAWLVDPANHVADLPSEAARLREVLAIDVAAAERRSGAPAGTIARLGAELARRRPSAVVGPGVAAAGAQATELASLVLLINFVLGNLGRTVRYGLDTGDDRDPPSSFSDVQALVADMAAGRVDVLLVHHADLVGALPAALGVAAALAKVPLVVSFATRPDATSERAHLILPDAHALESFGDVSPRRGVIQLGQPVMTPLHDVRAASQVLLDLFHGSPGDFYDYLEARLKIGDAERRAAQQRGGLWSQVEPETAALRPEALETPLVPAPAAAPAAPAGDLALLLFPTALRGADHPWLREVPDVISTISWSTWAELAPATAARLGVREADVVTVTTAAGSVELPAHIYPGLREGVVAVPLGTREPLALLGAATDSGGALVWLGARAAVARTGRRDEVLSQLVEPYRATGALVPSVSAAHPTLPPPAEPPGMYPPPEHPVHRWAMAIDLDRCIGCQACVVACYAENNVPVVGAQAAADGRNMAWLQIERTVRETAPGRPLAIDFLPMLCQQCGAAPCETVCPVYATYHTPEGLNAQVYNRCVGTRYCSNNCPYKVRVFNWLDPEFAGSLRLQLNPDVTVRSKGVMEKCTFCAQRIRYAENRARDEKRGVREGEIAPACAQTCPAQAIVFGDLHDPSSRVSALANDGRAFHALDELNTRPAISYLARVREDEP